MRKALPLVLAGVVAQAWGPGAGFGLGALGSVALAAGLTDSPSEAAQSVDDAATVPGVYGTR